MDIDNINIDRLRRELIDYYTAAMFIVSPIAMVDLTRIENANGEEIIRLAIKNGFDIDDYTYKSFHF